MPHFSFVTTILTIAGSVASIASAAYAWYRRRKAKRAVPGHQFKERSYSVTFRSERREGGFTGPPPPKPGD